MRSVLVIVALALLAAACGRGNPAPPVAPPPAAASDSTDSSDIIARVDDHVLRARDLLAIDPQGTLTADEVASVTENWIERELLLKVADRRGVNADTAVRWKVEDARAGVILEALGSRVRAETGDDTEARRRLRQEVEVMRAQSRVESNPWRVK